MFEGKKLAIANFCKRSNIPRPPIVSPSSRFYCALQADSQRGGDVWTVMYRRSKKQTKPWLRMVRTMGKDWDTQSRCEEIAKRLEIFREDGLLGFEYRSDRNTPGPAGATSRPKKQTVSGK